ncbi:hypothetical protein BgiMline_000004 [Biomphalaria glabrata]
MMLGSLDLNNKELEKPNSGPGRRWISSCSAPGLSDLHIISTRNVKTIYETEKTASGSKDEKHKPSS